MGNLNFKIGKFYDRRTRLEYLKEKCFFLTKLLSLKTKEYFKMSSFSICNRNNSSNACPYLNSTLSSFPMIGNSVSLDWLLLKKFHVALRLLSLANGLDALDLMWTRPELSVEALEVFGLPTEELLGDLK